MRKTTRFLSLLVLLMTAATGAWATTPNSIVINGTPQVGDKSISLTYHFDPNNVPGLEAYAPTLKVKCAADNKWDEMWLSLSEVSSGTTNISLSNLGEFEAGKTYEVCFAYNNGNWVDEVFQSFVPAAASAGYTVSLKEGTEDADKWTVTVGTSTTANPLPVGGLSKGDAVTLKYSGDRQVKSITATFEPDPLATPLTMEAITAGTIQVNINGTLSSGMKYSVNGGTKTTITSTTVIGDLKAGDKVQFYGNGTQTQVYGNVPEVSIWGSGDGFQTKVYGNIMSLLDETDYATNYTALPNAEYVFYRLFKNNATLIDASELLLPAETLAPSCYQSMFDGCSALTAAPVLPATKLVNYCYQSMFNHCKKLATVTCLATSGINQGNSTSYWLTDAGSEVQGTKTFNAVSTANWPSGVNGIPTGWTRVNIDN